MFEGREIKRGQIYFAWLPIVEDSQQGEQRGNRPVIILQNNKGNKFSPTVIVAKISSKINKFDKVPTHVRVGEREGLDGESIILLEQIETINKNRLKKYIGTVDEIKLKEIDRVRNISMGEVRVIDSLPVHIREEVESQLKLLTNYSHIILNTKSNLVKITLEKEREEMVKNFKGYCLANRINYKMITEEEKIIETGEYGKVMEG